MWLAATIVTIAFAAAHVSPAATVYLIFTSASLTLARLWFGSLRATLLIHAANNAVVSAIALTAF
ncbi:type II CAAX prenyl endopeptidase Rce1 family protein [uncultured Corynebacterium sp.]|nr:CPBP family glutamic-type intramembrane protease [uncultured Corynebacterium sp.]